MISQQTSAELTIQAPGIPAPETVRRILVCQQRQIGDVLLATPAVELLAKRYPQAEIHFFTEKKCVPVLENNPYIQKIIVLDKEKVSGQLQQFLFYWRTGRDNYDLLVNFQHLPRCTWISALSNAKVRLSSGSRWYAKFIYTHLAKSLPGYAAASKASWLRPLGIAWSGEKPGLYLTDAERVRGQTLLLQMGLEGKNFISVDATHRDPERLWPAESYAALMDMIVNARPDLHFMLSYGPGEEGYISKLINMSANPGHLHTLPAVQPLRDVAACMEQAVMHLGNCSAPRHMAVAMGIPTFGIVDPRGSGWTFPSAEHACIELRDVEPDSPQAGSEGNLVLLTPEVVFPRFMTHLEKYARKK